MKYNTYLCFTFKYCSQSRTSANKTFMLTQLEWYLSSLSNLCTCFRAEYRWMSFPTVSNVKLCWSGHRPAGHNIEWTLIQRPLWPSVFPIKLLMRLVSILLVVSEEDSFECLSQVLILWLCATLAAIYWMMCTPVAHNRKGDYSKTIW